MFSLLVTLCGLLCAVYAQEDEREIARAALQNPDLFQGDMLGFDPDERNVIPWDRFRWPGAKVPFTLDPSVSAYTNLIYQGMQNYHSYTCVRFIPRTNEQNYIHIFWGQGCYSHVGMTGGQQPVSLGNGCMFVGTVVHELGHALGFYHEQSRSDRDNYLDIYIQNVQSGMEFNFQKLAPDQNILITPFDYGSIMIYGNTSFSKDGKSITMWAKNGQKLLDPFDKQGMTQSDVTRINNMYNCR